MRLTCLPLLCLSLIAHSTLAQTPRIDKVEPPNWWTNMKWDQLQLMVYGAHLDGITAAFQNETIAINAIHSVPNSNYAFIDMDLAGIEPGTYTLQLTRGDEHATIDFPIFQRNDDPRKNQGFSVDDVVYLITPDRFANGNPTNDHVEGMLDEYDPSNHRLRHGGDLTGITDRLDYLADLGITAIWLNPILENNISNSYHGYQATDLYRIDPRYGTNEDYKHFVEAAHERGIKIIFDHVSNHIGVKHPWLDDLPTNTWVNGSKEDHLLHKHYKMAFSDPYADPYSDELLRSFWFVDSMPDMNQRDPFVANYLIQNSIWWMAFSGLDGYREDTYPYPDQAFLAEWAKAILDEFPAANIVGEIWESAPAYLSLFQKNTPLPRAFETNLPTIMDFALAEAWRDYLEDKARLNEVYKVLAQDFVYADPNGILTLFDNHDMARGIFISKGHTQKVKQVLTMLLTTRGIPQLLYGTEINMMGGASHVELRADFPGGFPGHTRDAFTEAGRTAEENDMFTFVRTLLHLRKKHEVLRRGRLVHYPVTYRQNVYKYLRMDGEEMILVVINGEGQGMDVDLSELLHWFGERRRFEDLVTGKMRTLSNEQTLPVEGFGAYVMKVLP